jgi:hypothetical protein
LALRVALKAVRRDDAIDIVLATLFQTALLRNEPPAARKIEAASLT